MGHDDAVEALKLWIAKSRGYADFDTWPEEQQRYGGLVAAFAIGLLEQHSIELRETVPLQRGEDPPDAIAAGPIGIELTEFVDQARVEAAVQQRQLGLQSQEWRYWTIEQFHDKMRGIVARKDKSNPNRLKEFIEYWLVVHTDEPALTPDLVRDYCEELEALPCALISRCFILMSYFPAEKGRPVIEVALKRV